jgi:phosphate:Na+ symporter
MLAGLADGLVRSDRRRLAEARRLDRVLDGINAAIRRYLAGLDRDAMTEADSRRVAEILTFAGNLEQAGDVVHHNLLAMAGRSLKHGRPLKPEQLAELTSALARVGVNLRNAASLFVNGDVRSARLLVEEKRRFRDLENAATAAQLAAMRAGQATEAGAVHLDLLRDIRRVNTHLVAAAAYPLLERAGELLPNRLTAEAGQP